MRQRTLLRTGGLLLATLALLAPATAAAQTIAVPQRWDANRFEPAERGSDWFVLDSLDFRGKFRPAFGVTAQFAHRPLEVFDSSGGLRSEGNDRPAVIANTFTLHPGLAVVLVNRLRLGATIPLQLVGDGEETTVRNVLYRPPANGATVGDLRLAADVRLFGEYGDGITGSFGLTAHLPTGDQPSYLSDGTFLRISPRFQIAGIAGPFNYAVRVGVNIRDEKDFADSTIGTELSYGGSFGFTFARRKILIGPEIYGATTVANSQVWKQRTSPTEALLGAHGMFGAFRGGAGIGVGLTDSFGTPDYRFVLGLEWTPFQALDKDGDGIEDQDDDCREVPGVKSDEAGKNGCPAEAPKVTDRDGDGVLDTDDACIDVVGVKSDDPKKNGCPVPKVEDRDGDGIVDSADACMDVPGVKNDDPKKNGCPSDKDSDGVVDTEDACPEVAGVKSSDPKTNGCPVDTDRDKDGIANGEDACPDAAGPKNTDPEKNGCPVAAVQNGVIKIREQVQFKTGSADIQAGKETDDVLQGVLKILKEHAEIKKVRVEGHTDNKGDAKRNRKLSADRAASVVKWLTKNGIDAARLTSVGFGQDKPIASNDTEDGRKKNRRVELHIE